MTKTVSQVLVGQHIEKKHQIDDLTLLKARYDLDPERHIYAVVKSPTQEVLWTKKMVLNVIDNMMDKAAKNGHGGKKTDQ